MLTRIQIQNFAISSTAEVELDRNMTVLTGETGAGKSILIDALNLVLGDRADAGVVRHGSDKAVINASFELDDDSSALSWLTEQDMSEGAECHLRRVISAEGRSRAFINNNPVNLSTLKTLGEQLIEIHGQHEHQTLTLPNKQRELLDSSGKYLDCLQQTRSVAIELKRDLDILNAHQTQSADHDAQIELLKYQIDELLAASIDELNIEELLKHHETLSNADVMKTACWQTAEALKSDDQSIYEQLSESISRLENWQEQHDEIKSALQILHDMQALASEAHNSVDKAAEQLDSDPEELNRINQQVEQCHALARKHQIKMQELTSLLTDKQQQLASFEQSETDTAELETRVEQLQNDYAALAKQLHKHRSQHADKLSSEVSANMQELGMQGGQFEIRVEYDEDNLSLSPYGADQVSYWVSANPGQPLQPLSKVASGGELSRISLAITVICATVNQAPTMIFDEVDSGIGGGVAEIVGKQLKAIGQSQQVLCVTHLPQVAAQAEHHFRVVKTSTDEHTESRVIELEADARTNEIARMLGGVEITSQSLAHARELLGQEVSSQASQ